jgi:phosphoglycerate dehydrogenase-like enzyme
VRRQPRGDEEIEVVSEGQLENALAEADHVVNILPANDSTQGYMNAQRFAAMKPGARFYNIGRGTTVDQDALLRALESGTLALAYLDVTDPEPLPPEHPLWTAPNCFITPHTAGGHKGEFERLVQHFLSNLRLFEKGESLRGQVI